MFKSDERISSGILNHSLRTLKFLNMEWISLSSRTMLGVGHDFSNFSSYGLEDCNVNNRLLTLMAIPILTNSLHWIMYIKPGHRSIL